MPTTSPLLTSAEAMAFLRCKRSFLTEHRAELGGIKVGSKLMFRLSDLTAYLDRRQIAAEPPARKTAPVPIRKAPTLGRGEINPVSRKPWGAYGREQVR